MKVERIRFKNLNSLVGEWEIDLTDPAYVGSGIFAITGPTGAGKSTILDALCLALYGQTPRLGKITKSSNEILSRQTGECFAAVDFTTITGRYCCHWSQHRARKKAGGELQAPRHELSKIPGGEIICNSIREVAEEVERVTGMDFKRFTRTMLLAQGEFAAFLQAAPDERAPILEQITGTEIYSQISMGVYQRLKQEEEQLERLNAALQGVVLLDDEQIKAFGEELSDLRQTETKQKEALAATLAALGWLKTIEDLQKERDTLSATQQQLQTELVAFGPQAQRLKQAQNAATLESDYTLLQAVRKQCANDAVAEGACEKREQNLVGEVRREESALKTAQQEENRCNTTMLQLQPLLQQVRTLDQRVNDKEASVATERTQRDTAQSLVDGSRKSILKEQQKLDDLRQERVKIETYLQEHRTDEWLVTNLTAVSEQLKQLSQTKEWVTKHTEVLADARSRERTDTKTLREAEKKVAECRQQEREVSARLHAREQKLVEKLQNRALDDYRRERSAKRRELELLTRIADLEEQRKKLEDGVACPLCGALDHPYARGNVPSKSGPEQHLDQLEALIAECEALEGQIKQIEKEVKEALSAHHKAQQAESRVRNTAEMSAIEVRALEDRLSELRRDLVARESRLDAQLSPLGLPPVGGSDVTKLGKDLEQRLSGWQAQTAKLQQAKSDVTTLTSSITALAAVLGNQEAALKQQEERLSKAESELAALTNQRRTIFGTDDPTVREQQAQKQVDAAAAWVKEVEQLLVGIREKLSVERDRRDNLQHSIKEQQEKITAMQDQLVENLQRLNFTNEAEFKAAILPLKQRQGLEGLATQFNERQTQLETRQQDCQQKLQEEVDKRLTEMTLPELEKQHCEQEEAQQILIKKVAAITNRLEENERQSQGLEKKREQWEQQREECRGWRDLHTLIGSADGKKYRNFAQGLTFEVMVQLANQQLRKMNDRYLLLRDKTQPLELNVVDNYQGGETRTTKNLSGGESFIVSLALALGLAGMVSKNVHVDSLFLDEGFGALDDEALEVALNTLATLQQDGKLIGIISHVAAIKERISTQIQISPLLGGNSSISGAGCERKLQA